MEKKKKRIFLILIIILLQIINAFGCVSKKYNKHMKEQKSYSNDILISDEYIPKNDNFELHSTNNNDINKKLNCKKYNDFWKHSTKFSCYKFYFFFVICFGLIYCLKIG